MAGGLHVKTGIAVASLLLAALLGARASAQATANVVLNTPIPDTGITANELARFMTALGQPATVEDNKAKGQVPNDNAYIVTSKISDIEFDIQLYDCKDGHCRTLQYQTGWSGCPVALDAVNQWNSQRRWLKAVVVENACFGAFDVIFAPGTSYRYLVDTLGTWDHMVQDYRSYLNTGALSRRTLGTELNDKLATLEVGKTKYSDVLNRFGLPASDTHLAEGGRSLTYALAQMTNTATPPATVASAPPTVVVTMTFDEHGRLEKLSPSPERTSETSSGIVAPGRALNTFR